MWGSIDTRDRCPKCGKKFPSSTGKNGYPEIICPTCLTRPQKYELQFWWQGQSRRVLHSKDGNPLRTWGEALATLKVIQVDGKAKFDPTAYQVQRSHSFPKVWEEFIKRYEKKGSTYDKLKAIGKHHLLPYFEECQMSDIKAVHIDKWWSWLQDKGNSEKYCNDILQWLITFFKKAWELNIIDEPIRKFPDPLTLEEKYIPWLTREAQERILEHIPIEDKPIFMFLFRTGVRVNEATGLQRADVLASENMIVIRHTINRKGELGPTKARKVRTIYLTKHIKECLKVTALSKFQFINKWGRRYSDDYLNSTFKKACIKTGIEPIPLKNASRHSKGHQWIKEGQPMSTVRAGLGHSDERMTRRYARQQAEDLKELYEDSITKNPRTNLEQEESGQ